MAQWLRIHLRCRRHGFDPWVGKILWRRKWQPTPVFLPGKFHGQRSLVGYSPSGCKRVRHNLAAEQQWLYPLTPTDLKTVGASKILHLPPNEYGLRGRSLAVTLCSVVSDTSMTLWTATCQTPLSLGFLRQEWSGLPFPSSGDLPDPGTEPESPALQVDSLPWRPLGSPRSYIRSIS